MTVSELLQYLQAYQERQRNGFKQDNSLMILLSSPSIGPRAMCGVENINPGIDWESGRLILTPQKKLVVKTNDEDLWDMSRDTLSMLWMDAYNKKRKPWYFDRLKRIYERAGMLDLMVKLAAGRN